MRYNKVLLVTSPGKTGLGPVRPNIGLGCLAQVLAQNGIGYDVLDMQLGYTERDLGKKIAAYKPDLLGVDLFSNGYMGAYRMLERVKRSFPSLAIAAGGPHVSCFKEAVLLDCPAIDYGVYLEGEYPLLELCRGDAPAGIGNLIHREGSGAVRVNPARDFISDLDSLPFPRYEKFELGKYSGERPLISSRGCPQQCVFCAVRAVNGGIHRIRSPRHVADEIGYWYGKGYRHFSFQDDNFTFHRENVYGICDEIGRRGFKGLSLICAGVRADRVDAPLLKRMREAGFKSLAIGVEAGNDRMLALIKKGERLEDLDRAVGIACRLGFDVYLHFLFPLPGETAADIEDAIAFAQKHPVFYAEWFNVIPYPGTELYDNLSRDGSLTASPHEYLNNASVSLYGVDSLFHPLFRTAGITPEERVSLAGKIKKVRRCILRKGITRWLGARGVPPGFRHCLGYALSSDIVTRYLLRNSVRGLADKIRFSLPLRSGHAG